jgi:hypothetical protein
MALKIRKAVIAHLERLIMIRTTIFAIGFGISSTAVAAPLEICVRNYKSDRFNPCGTGFQRYAEVETTDGEIACVLTYTDSNCKNAQGEFEHVRATTDQIVCTIDYYQPPISDGCATNPDEYDWVVAAFEPNP